MKPPRLCVSNRIISPRVVAARGSRTVTPPAVPSGADGGSRADLSRQVAASALAGKSAICLAFPPAARSCHAPAAGAWRRSSPCAFLRSSGSRSVRSEHPMRRRSGIRPEHRNSPGQLQNAPVGRQTAPGPHAASFAHGMHASKTKSVHSCAPSTEVTQTQFSPQT